MPEPINLCDQPDCKEPATHSYTWEWGATGTCCAKHQVILQQNADNLARKISFALLASSGTPPLQREERVRLKAEALVANEELAEAKARGLDLYRQNTLLTQQIQSMTVRNREAEAQRKDAVLALERAEARLQELESENATLTDELSRLRVLVELPPAEETQPGVGPTA